MEEDVHFRQIGTRLQKGDSTVVFQATDGPPAHLPIFNPVLIEGVPFVPTSDLHNLMAALIVMIGHFLNEPHKLRKIVKVGEQRVDLLNRRFHCNGCKMLNH
jgi:hypothetical protein